ncbi:MAG: bifunctional diaminohydroxyphosphoribosylaminopyrimidine deaminase/5-amino-6-(5-phosphoribosylamino)uracil reductase RibD, partial [Phycisphaerales bacterium]
MNPAAAKRDHHHLLTAARLAARGIGRAEPNPPVGCVLVDPDDRVVGWGYHTACGQPHAEVEALRRAGNAARGTTAYVTLEPCNHTGRTGPCTEALIKAGVKEVVIARPDPNPVASGGIQRLKEAGIAVRITEICPEAIRVSAPFAHRVTTGLPWVIAKWAQTLDGRIATRTGESQWISGPRSRHTVHRRRARVDAILTGIGTVQHDDPMLTARNVRLRRTAKRVVIDPKLETALDARLVRTADEVPTIIYTTEAAIRQQASARQELERRGVVIRHVPAMHEDPAAVSLEEVSLEPVLRSLVAEEDVTNVLTEAGSGLLRRLFAGGLVTEALVFIAPKLLADEHARSCLTGWTTERLTDGIDLDLIDLRRRGDDALA